MTQAERDKTLIELKQAILGNGVKGLAERMEDRELWEKEHERNHPGPRPDRKTVVGMVAAGATVSGSVFAGLTLLFKAVGWI